MIPKVIHYCWFGRNELPKSAVKCINSWRKFFPDYEIKEWNEDNFDVNMIPYTREAYQTKKYAFVSDYARFWILYHFGGIYFDTDVEIIKSLDDIIAKGAFMGIESVATGNPYPYVNPGLGIGAPAGLSFYEEMLNCYQKLSYIKQDGTIDNTTIVIHTSNMLRGKGLSLSNEPQCVSEMWIYPQDYFNPFNSITGVITKTLNTRSIHWYSKTWLKKQNTLIEWVVRKIHLYFGPDSLSGLRRFCNKLQR